MSRWKNTWTRADATGYPLLIARAILAAVFISMGLSKALAPVDFLKLLREFELGQSPLLLNGIAATLPWLEILCGLLLVLGLRLKGAAAVLFVMLWAFIVVVLFRTLRIHAAGDLAFCAIRFDCGCGSGEVNACRKIWQNTGLSLLAALVFMSRSGRFCLEKDASP